MEPDPVQQAKHHEAIAEFGAQYGIVFENGVAEIIGLRGGPLKIDLTATEKGHWLVMAVYQAFEQGVAIGKAEKAAELRAALGIQNTVEE